MTDHLLRGQRILFVLPGLKLGGAERQALLLARALRQEWQAETCIWAFGEPEGEAISLCNANHIPWKNVVSPRLNRWKRVWYDTIRFGWQLRQARPLVILPFTAGPNLACGLSWRISRARLCIWNQRDEGLGMIGRRLEPWALRLTPWFTANSEMGAAFLRSLGVHNHQLSVIHNGVSLPPPQKDRIEWRERLGIDLSTLLVVMVANLQKLKDHPTLVQAWKQICVQLPAEKKAVLALAGAFHGTQDALQSLAHELGIATTVHFLGAVDDISGLLGAADMAAYSSFSEGLPNAVLECMAAGLPVVATDIPGVREAVGEQGFPLLVPKGDVGQMALRITDLLHNEALRRLYGEQNRRRIETEFRPEKMVDNMAEWIIRGLGHQFGQRSSGKPSHTEKST